ncbi:MAG: alanine--tRNA ligase [Bacteroidales bacterium]|jgi:alanyl-tRNA synthetase|nr:alanine--tRNA ligase [Bacteroidales bacterium]
MNSNEIRKAFLDFFASKAHIIVPSAPMVIKNDPTLMFTNAGMNQFKDIFLDNSPAFASRAADTQKCLRVSGKHNDLEEVGKDTYHHTMFEMLGNWSFGDYFKREAIDWAWEFLTQVVKLDANRLYATVFEGDRKDNTDRDMEAYEMWKQYLPETRILFGNKKDNFWEMGEIGPCGPCSEIHIDLRDETERIHTDGAALVNKDNPLVIEIWNLVFMQFNRLASGELQPLSAKHVDTGMGFERLCMAVQGKKSNYDTDVFQPIIQKVATVAHKTYGEDRNTDIALRVVADHLRAICFAIADGQLPSNNGAGYVIRRILRRAIRYGFTFLNFNEPFIYTLVADLANQMGGQFSELKAQQQLIEKVIREEENSFLKTLASGIAKFESCCQKLGAQKIIAGHFAFELFDTFGFPIDLTQLMATEKGLSVDMEGFQKGLAEQKERSRAAATVETEDWVVLISDNQPTQFVGYSRLASEAKIVKYRSIKTKGKQYYQIVLDITPFYAESGGQMGDTGVLESINERIEIFNTVKENNLTMHFSITLPDNLTAVFVAKVDETKRISTQNNHSATHLLHFALREVLGTHVEQKGSLVAFDRLRFDFSHFSKVTSEELNRIETIANSLIRANTPLQEHTDTPIEEARKMGAVALFGEKYGDRVRVIQFGDSIELCGGTHTAATGNIGLLKIVSESAIAAGVRRIEAVTGQYAESWVNEMQQAIEEMRLLVNSPNLTQAIQKLLQEQEKLRKEVEFFQQESVRRFTEDCLTRIIQWNDFHVIKIVSDMSADVLKQTAYQVRNSCKKLAVILGTAQGGKANLVVALSDDLIAAGKSASQLIREVSKIIEGGGGGQPALATAGGKKPEALQAAINKAMELL